MKYIGWLVLILLMLPVQAMSAEMISRIAAVVNDDIITTYQLDQELKAQLAKQELNPSPAQLGVIRRELLDRLIEEALVKQRIEALNLTVTEEELETAILDVQEQNQLSREQLKEAILAQGMTYDAYRDNLRQQILRYKLISAEVRSKVEVSEQEVVEYYRAHLDEYRSPGQVRLSAITFPLPPQADQFQREAIRQVAAEALQRLRQGDSIDTVAEAYSAGYNAFTATLGLMAYREIVPEFVAAIAPVDTGDYSDPVEKADAVHLLRVDERVAGGLRQFDEVKNEIYQLILEQKTDARAKEWTKSLERQAFIDIRL